MVRRVEGEEEERERGRGEERRGEWKERGPVEEVGRRKKGGG